LERLDAGLAADAATRRDHKVSLEALAEIGRGDVEDYVNCVGLGFALRPAHPPYITQLRMRIDESFGEQKPGGQLLVMAGRAHRQRKAPSAEADLERLFHRQLVRLVADNPRAPLH